MRSLIKLTLASLAAVALFAGMASAQTTPKFSGNVGAAFGMYNFGETNGAKGTGAAISEYATSWESNLRMTMETDKLTAIVRYRARATNMGNGTASGTQTSGTAFTSASNDIYHEIWWKAADNFSIGFGKFQGQAWSQPFSGGYLVINPIGDGTYWMNWTGIPGIDLEFNAGVVQVGVAISSQCKPGCGPTSSGAAITTQNTQSITPHLTGKFGDIAIRAQLPQTSGDIGCTAIGAPATVAGDCKKAEDVVTATGSGYQIGVSWAGMPGVSVGLDLTSFTDKGLEGYDQDRARTGTGVKADFAGITVLYFSLKDSTYVKSADTTTSEMTVRYTLPMGSGQIIPEYRSQTWDDKSGKSVDKDGKAQALTHTEFRLIGNVNY